MNFIVIIHFIIIINFIVKLKISTGKSTLSEHFDYNNFSSIPL